MRLFFLRRSPGPINLDASSTEFFAMKLPEHVRSTHGQDGGVVLDILHGQMYSLNLVGSRMLELLKQGQTEPQIAERLSQEFGVGREIVASDLHEFLAHLQSHHLLHFHSPANP
jgi:Coenzyme PQQ synthesis protein D (PqqD)